MFWGLILEPGRRYTQQVDKPFHISQAAMDTSTGDNDVCQVMVIVDGKNYLVSTLQKNKTIQVPLDLYFKTGETISFLTNGKCNIHLTGYLDPEFDDEELEDEEDDDSESEEVPKLVEVNGKANKKRQLDTSNEGTVSKKMKQEKKQKKNAKQESDESDEDDSDDESEDGLQKILDGEVSSDDNDESFKVNSIAEGDESEDDSDEDDDDEDDDDIDEAEEEDSEKEEQNTSNEVDPTSLSKSQRRRLREKKKKLQQQGQVNGVAEKKKDNQQQQKKEKQAEKQKEKQGDKQKQKENQGEKQPQKEKKALSGGVQIEDLKVGTGPVAKPGKMVQVYYEGRLKQNNKKFDSCDKGPGFKFRLGAKEVISGWEVGVAGMRVGGKRKILCPPAMAYGAKGSPPVIPPNSSLVFEVELKNVK